MSWIFLLLFQGMNPLRLSPTKLPKPKNESCTVALPIENRLQRVTQRQDPFWVPAQRKPKNESFSLLDPKQTRHGEVGPTTMGGQTELGLPSLLEKEGFRSVTHLLWRTNGSLF